MPATVRRVERVGSYLMTSRLPAQPAEQCGTAASADTVDPRQTGNRLARGVLAQIFATSSRVVTQLAFLPLLFVFLSAGEVGLWSILLSMPTYLVIIAQGLATAGANAAIGPKAGEAEQVGTIYRFVERRALAATALAWLLICGLTEALLARTVIDPSPLTVGQLRWVAVFLGASAMLTAALAALEVPLRAAGRYPTFVVLMSSATAAELVIVGLALLLGAEIVGMAASLAAARAMVWLYGRHLAGAASPASFTSGAADHAALWRPAVAFMLLPLAYGINLQAIVVLIGAFYGTTALAGFVATRMLARMFDLFTGFVFSASYYESAHGAQADDARLLRVTASLTLLTLLIGAAFWAALLMLGPWLQTTWTSAKTSFDPWLASVIVAAAIWRGLAAMPSAILAARNQHERFTATYLGLSVAAFAACAFAASHYAALAVVMLPLLVAEAVQTGVVLRQFFRLTGSSPPDFTRRVFSRSAVAEWVQWLSIRPWRRRAHV